MKAFQLIWVLLFLLGAAVVQLPAQQSEANRKRFEEIKTKAEMGDASAQFELGIDFYSPSSGIERDRADGVSSSGIPSWPIYSNNGTPKDSREAVKWFRKAADQGFAKAELHLGICYFFGTGVRKDLAASVKWYRKAAEHGEARSQVHLGYAYAKGYGVAKDPVEAVKWYRKAAELGFAQGQYNLGVFYFRGEGVVTDYVMAHYWLNLAAAQGHADEESKKSLPNLESRMTAEQIAEAQRLTRTFKPRKTLEPGETGSPEEIFTSRPSATGTGFFITDDGFLITNEHVVKESSQVRLVTGAGIIAAKVVKVDAANDLALLKAEGRFVALPVVAVSSVRSEIFVENAAINKSPSPGGAASAPSLCGSHRSFSSNTMPLLTELGWLEIARFYKDAAPNGADSERRNNVSVVSAKILADNHLDANTKERKFEDVVKSAEQAAVLVLVY